MTIQKPAGSFVKPGSQWGVWSNQYEWFFIPSFGVPRTGGSLIWFWANNRNRRFFYRLILFYFQISGNQQFFAVIFVVAKFLAVCKKYFEKRIFYKNSLFFWKQFAKNTKKTLKTRQKSLQLPMIWNSYFIFLNITKFG